MPLKTAQMISKTDDQTETELEFSPDTQIKPPEDFELDYPQNTEKVESNYTPETGIDFRRRRPGTYSYNPKKIRDKSFNQMRFEIGDIYVDGDVDCSFLSDEEYQAIIEDSSSWKAAKIAILKQILFLFLYEVDYTIDGLSVKLSDRYNRFKKLLDELEKGTEVPSVDDSLIGVTGKGGHYFYYGMLENPRKFDA